MSTEIATKLKDTDIGLIPGDWDVVTIPKIAQNFDNKRKPLSSAEREKMKGVYPYYGAAGIIDWVNNFIFDGKYLLVAEDGTVTDEEGYPTLQLTDGKFWVSNHAHILQCEDFIETKFLYYALKNQNIRAFVTGAVQPKLNQENLNSIQFPYPTKKEERNNICEVLSSIDEKIAVNNKINSNLEKLSEILFKQWFIDADLQKWAVGKLSDISDITIGRTPPRMQKQWFSVNPEDIKWISIRDLGNCGVYIDKTAEYLTQEAVDNFNIPTIPANTVILSFKLTVGRVAITTEKMLSNEAIAHIKLKDAKISPEYIYLALKKFDYSCLGTTSSIATAVNSKTIKDLPIIIPDEVTIKKFTETIEPIFKLILRNTKESESLSNIRTSILSRLMIGKIRVK
jgi:type I restriction enzyme S subunit